MDAFSNAGQGAIDPSRGDLNVTLLHLILMKLGELRTRPPLNPPSEGDLIGLVLPDPSLYEERLDRLQRHTEYLKDKSLVKIFQPAGVFRVLRLTEKGQSYVQPELSEFAEKPMLPAIVKNVEEQIAVLTYPEPEKAGMVHALRQAVADKAPEVVAKILVEIGAKIAGL
jgi:hypothetical protein